MPTYTPVPPCRHNPGPMPELPEVETMVRGVRDSLEGWTIDHVTDCGSPCRPMSITPSVARIHELSSGAVIDSVERLAKRVVLRLSNGYLTVFEPRMTGLILIEDPPSVDHLRLEWSIRRRNRSSKFWIWDRRGLGTIRLYTEDEYAIQLGPQKLGPDALTMTRELWRERLSRTRRPIKVAMLDQKLVAGIGNLYASEILHLARIHPERSTDRINSQQLTRLADSTLEILQTAIRYEGSTLSDGTYRNALNQDGRYQNEHRVYARTDEKCRTCQRGKIRRIVQAQRATFFCPACQR